MKFLLSTTLLLLALSPIANAKHHRDYQRGKVITATPVYKYVVKPQARQVCLTQTRHQGPTATILGGVVGGVIGHTNSKHKGVGTLAGVIIGSTIGQQIDRVTNRHSIKRNPSTNCHNKYVKTRVLKGYDVTYKYRGKVFHDFMRNKPSRFIKIVH